MLDYAELIKKVRFPRQLVAFSVVATQLLPFAVLLAGLIVVDAIVIAETRDTVLLSIPIAAGIVVLAAGMALAVASANVVFRDVEHLLAALLLPWFFLTPILYSLDELPGGLEDYDVVVDILRWANPLTPPLYALRDPLFYGEVPAAGDVVYLAVAAVVSLGVGALVFTPRRRPHRRRALELEHERGVVHPRLVRGRAKGGQALDVGQPLELDAVQHGRAEQRLREAGDAAGARRPRREPLAQAARGVDRACDHGIPLGVERQRAALPLRRGRRRVHCCRVAESCGVDARQHLDGLARRVLAAQLGEPGAVLGDEVEGEAVAPGGIGARTVISSSTLLAGRYRPRKRRAHAVPDDRVSALVEPVVRGGDVRAPGHGADVLHLARAVVSEPARGAASDHDPQRATRGPAPH